MLVLSPRSLSTPARSRSRSRLVAIAILAFATLVFGLCATCAFAFLGALEGVKCAANLDDRVDAAGDMVSGGGRDAGEVEVDAVLCRGTAGMEGNVASRGEACVWNEVRPAEEFKEEGLERKGQRVVSNLFEFHVWRETGPGMGYVSYIERAAASQAG